MLCHMEQNNTKIEIMEGMEIVMVTLITFGFVGLTTIGVIKGITNFKLRKRMIEAGLVNEEAMELLKDGSKESHFSALKWGLIFFFGGIALIAINNLDFYYDSSAAYGIVIVATSLGFLLYFAFMRNEIKKNEVKNK